MKRCALALLFLLLLCAASGVRAELMARDGTDRDLSPGETLAPGSTLRIVFSLDALPDSPALRLRLNGMTLVAVSFHTAGATPHPEIVYGSDGCVFLFAGPVRAGDTICLEALLRDTPGEAAAALLYRGEVWMEFPCAAQSAAVPSSAAVPAMAAAAPEAAASAQTQPEASGGRWALVLFCASGLGAALYACVRRLRAAAKRSGEKQ